MAADARFVEGFYAKAEVIQVARFFPRRRTASAAEFAIHSHEVNERSPSPQLNQANRVLASLNRASEDLAVEVKHAVEVDNA
jgi:hypothetical protein